MHQFNEDADPFAALDALEEMVAASPVDGASVVEDGSKSQGTSPLLTALISRQGSQDMPFPLPTSALQARQHFGNTGESMGPFDSSLGRPPFDESPLHKRGNGLNSHNHSLNYHDKYFDDTPSPDGRPWQKQQQQQQLQHHHQEARNFPADFDDDDDDVSPDVGHHNLNHSSSGKPKESGGEQSKEEEEELESWREKARRRRDEEDIHGLESTDWDDSGEDFSNGLEGLYSNPEEPLVVASVPNTGRSRKEPISPSGPRDAEWWDEAATEAVDETRLAAGNADDLDDLVGELLADSPSNEGCQFLPMFHCTSCDSEVLRCDSFVWMENVEYIFFRNNYPIFEKLLDGLIRCPGWSAFCCQCSWKSAPQSEDIGAVAEGLRWKSFVQLPNFLSHSDIEEVHQAQRHHTVQEIRDRKKSLNYRHTAYRVELQLRALCPRLYRHLMNGMAWADAVLWRGLPSNDSVYPEMEYIVYDARQGSHGTIEPHVELLLSLRGQRLRRDPRRAPLGPLGPGLPRRGQLLRVHRCKRCALSTVGFGKGGRGHLPWREVDALDHTCDCGCTSHPPDRTVEMLKCLDPLRTGGGCAAPCSFLSFKAAAARQQDLNRTSPETAGKCE